MMNGPGPGPTYQPRAPTYVPFDPTKAEAIVYDTGTSAGPVTSVYGRGGVVVAQSGDYTAAQVGALASPVISAQVILASGSSGSIANTHITINSIIKVYNISAGGTVGALSVTLAAGTGFTINSTSVIDSSTVYYEIVSY